MNITLDSTILVRAFVTPGGAARQVLSRIVNDRHRLVLSGEMLAETSRVLRYPRMQARHRMTEALIYDYVMAVGSVATMVRPDPIFSAPIRDANDIVVIATAIAGTAEVICTTDEDFFTAPASEFLKSSNILVCTDLELISLLCP